MPKSTRGPSTTKRERRKHKRDRGVKGQRPATLADVARLAGVVPMTVSRAFNKTGYVSELVRERVMRAAKELHYRPNVLARRLRGTGYHAIGVLLPDVANPFSAQLVAGIKEVFEAAEFTTFIATANQSVEQEKTGLMSFIDHRADGILVATIGTQLGDDALGGIAGLGVPLVTVGRPVSHASIDCVTADFWKGAYDAVSHLIRLGHKRIGFIGVSPQSARSLRRFQGYADALRDAGIAVNESYVVGRESGPAFSTQEDGYDGMIRLSRLKQPPTAVFARNDYTAIGTLGAAHEIGLSVPKDLAVAGFDNVPLSAFTVPPLTTVEQPIAEQGRRAAQYLMDRIRNPGMRGKREVCLDCRLVIRQSTDINAPARR